MASADKTTRVEESLKASTNIEVETKYEPTEELFKTLPSNRRNLRTANK